jgi:hypothetical protein
MADANNSKQAQKPEKKKEAKQQNAQKEDKPAANSKFSVATIEKDTPEFVAHRIKVLEDYLKANPPAKKGENLCVKLGDCTGNCNVDLHTTIILQRLDAKL